MPMHTRKINSLIFAEEVKKMILALFLYDNLNKGVVFGG